MLLELDNDLTIYKYILRTNAVSVENWQNIKTQFYRKYLFLQKIFMILLELMTLSRSTLKHLTDSIFLNFSLLFWALLGGNGFLEEIYHVWMVEMFMHIGRYFSLISSYFPKWAETEFCSSLRNLLNLAMCPTHVSILENEVSI